MVQHRRRRVDRVPTPPPPLPTETRLVTITLATELSRFTPFEMRDIIFGDPPLVRTVIVRGRRLVVLDDVLELSAIATPLSLYFDDQEAADDEG
jgi:hypothetical protein